MIRVLLFTFALYICTSNTHAGDQPFKIVYYDAYAPFSFRDNGKMTGIFVDIVEEIIHKRLDIPVIHRGYPWARAQFMVKQNEADGFVTVPTDARREFTNISMVPAVYANVGMMVRNGHPRMDELKQIKTIKDLQKFRVGTNLGNGWAKQNLKGINLFESRTIEQLLKMAVADHIDIIIHGESEERYYRKKLGYSNQLIILPNYFAQVTFNLCINKESRFAGLIDRFDSVLTEMTSNGELQAIIDQYQ